jgi:hypothetical protein
VSGVVDEAGLAFFNGLAGSLKIEPTEDAVPVAPNLSNLVAPAAAGVAGISFRLQVLEDGRFRELTEEERLRVVLRAPRIRMRNWRVEDVVVEHDARDGVAFTVGDLEGGGAGDGAPGA